MFVHQPVDRPKLLWREMLDLGERLAQGLMRDGWAVKVTTVSSSFVIYVDYTTGEQRDYKDMDEKEEKE